MPSPHTDPATQVPPEQLSEQHCEPAAQTLPSGPHSLWQVELQPSPLVTLPSSHCSPASTTLLPHTAVAVQTPMKQFSVQH